MSTTLPFSIAVKAVLLDGQNRCLLLRRAPSSRHFAGCWEWPGGKLDKGEDFCQGLRREVREEAGLEVEVMALVGAVQFELPTLHVIQLCMEVTAASQAVRLSEEHDDFAWVALGELARYKCAPGMEAFMLDYAKRKLATL